VGRGTGGEGEEIKQGKYGSLTDDNRERVTVIANNQWGEGNALKKVIPVKKNL